MQDIPLSNDNRRRKILIVDDQIFNIDALKIILKYINDIDTDRVCETAFNGTAAIALIKEDLQKNQAMGTNKSSFDLIFMDCSMPMMDGYEATGFIRQYLHDEGAP